MDPSEPTRQPSPKYTAEDLFGDIIDELEHAPLPPPAAEPEPEPEAVEEEPVLEPFGAYNLLEKVAVGGMAELFRARRQGDPPGHYVAIKRILPHLSANAEFVRMFVEEAKLAAQLDHPHIVRILDLGQVGSASYISMEFVDGRDLRSLLRRIRETKLPMPETLAGAVTLGIARALDCAHRMCGPDGQELRLVHRDVSPQNILVSFAGDVKLADFGIAKAATTESQGGTLKGKLLYMSPEQAQGLDLDGRSDLYSLGLVLAELLTGERAFQADSELGVLEKVRQGKVLDPRSVNPAISPEMGAILNRLLAKGVDQRYASARNLERDLKDLLARRSGEPTPEALAEYVNVLLKGTREELEALLADKYPLPAGMVPGQLPIRPTGRATDDPPTLPGTGTPAVAGAEPRATSAHPTPTPGAAGAPGASAHPTPGPHRAAAASRHPTPPGARPVVKPTVNPVDEPSGSRIRMSLIIALIAALLLWLAVMVFA